jgi:hypothetical protein
VTNIWEITLRKLGINSAAGLLLVLSSAAFAADFHAKGVVIAESAGDSLKKADAVVVFMPMAHQALNKMESSERVLSGWIEKQEKGLAAPSMIVHRPNTMTMPLEAGVPVRMYLKRFPDRDAYYPIAIFSTSSGAK